MEAFFCEHSFFSEATKSKLMGVYLYKNSTISKLTSMSFISLCQILAERQRVLKDPKAIMPVSFVTFDSRWGAAVCAQTQQSRNPTQWLTEWAPEPRDVYWQNLSIPFFTLSIRRFMISISVFALIFFYMIPIAFVQSLANLEGLEKVAPFLKPVIEMYYLFLVSVNYSSLLPLLLEISLILFKVSGLAIISTIY